VSLSFSPDGSTLASTGTLVVKSTLSLDFARAVVNHYLSGPDPAQEMELCLLETSTGRRLRSSRRNGLAVFSPDSRTLATSHEDGTLKLYDVPKPPP
jgi:WD40 repeat protein